jgi:SAM-dependent methyltransferase
VLFAKVGYEVSGFDLSPNNIAIARRLAEKYDLAGRTNFSVSVAEKLDYPDEHFDVIAGVDILHHVTIGPALAECKRVLKPGGVAVFHEPTRVPVFDRLRETRLARRLVPREASLDRHITHDERKLTPADLELIKAAGFDFSAERFLLFARLDRFVRNPNSKGPSFLEKTDARLFKMLPPLKGYGGVIVLVLRKQGP